MVTGGELWTFRFAADYCIVAYPAGSTGPRNSLAKLLLRLFGDDEGQCGTGAWLRSERDARGWRAVVVGRQDARAPPLVPRVRVGALPALRLGAGRRRDGRTVVWADGALEGGGEVWLPGPIADGCVAVPVTGSSIAGWRSEIPDGD